MNEKKKSVELAQVFNYGGKNGVPVRTQVVNGVVWFAARDLCMALGITWSGHTLGPIPGKWKGLVKFTTPGGIQELSSVTEPGMYKLVLRCNSSEEADRFTDWVAGDVLPSIRKTGKYELGGSNRPTIIQNHELNPISGIIPIFYKDEVLYNYCEMCVATGVKPNSGRKKRMPSGFRMLWGRSFVTLEYAKLMEGRANLRKLEAEAKAMQLPLFQDDDTQG